MKYNFDEVIDRRGTNCIKWDGGMLLKQFGVTEHFDDDTISLFLADMDFPCPEPVLKALHDRVDQKMFGYTMHLTSPDYTEAVQGWFKRRHDWEIDADSIVYSPGTVEAINALVRAFSEEGDGIIVQRPVYDPFMRAAESNGRRVVSNSLINDDGYYRIDFDDFEEKARDPGNTLFILCSPHNPVGRVWTPEELTRMAEICLANDVIVVSDEVHGDIVRTGQTHYPIQTLVDDDRLIACTAINKTFNTAGLHCSNIIVNDKDMRERLSAEMGMKMPTPFAISALIAAYNEGEEWLAQVNEYIDGNLHFLDDFIRDEMPKVSYQIPEGTYIGWLDFRGYGLTPEEVHQKIYVDANVVLEDGQRFGPEGEGFQRICVPSARSVLIEAMERIAAQFKGL